MNLRQRIERISIIMSWHECLACGTLFTWPVWVLFMMCTALSSCPGRHVLLVYSLLVFTACGTCWPQWYRLICQLFAEGSSCTNKELSCPDQTTSPSCSLFPAVCWLVVVLWILRLISGRYLEMLLRAVPGTFDMQSRSSSLSSAFPSNRFCFSSFFLNFVCFYEFSFKVQSYAC